MTPEAFLTLPKAQRDAFLALHQRPLDNPGPDYLTFIHSASSGFSKELVVPWAGMFIAIEPDGYTHS
jgi:hypothetical protein